MYVSIIVNGQETMKLRMERDKRVRGRKGKEKNLILNFNENCIKKQR